MVPNPASRSASRWTKLVGAGVSVRSAQLIHARNGRFWPYSPHVSHLRARPRGPRCRGIAPPDGRFSSVSGPIVGLVRSATVSAHRLRTRHATGTTPQTAVRARKACHARNAGLQSVTRIVSEGWTDEIAEVRLKPTTVFRQARKFALEVVTKPPSTRRRSPAVSRQSITSER
jgi:hypothetical protein